MTTNHETRKQRAIDAMKSRPAIDCYDLLCDAGLEEAVWVARRGHQDVGNTHPYTDYVRAVTIHCIEQGFIPVHMAEAYTRG